MKYVLILLGVVILFKTMFKQSDGPKDDYYDSLEEEFDDYDLMDEMDEYDD